MSDDKVSILAITKSTGGTALYNKTVLQQLDPARFASHTLCLSEASDAYAAQLREAGLGAESMDMNRYRLDPAGDFRVFRRAVEILRERKVDVIVCHGSKAGFLGRALGAYSRTPAVYCQASLPFLRRIQGAKAPAYWAIELGARAFRGHIVALTEGARRTTLDFKLASPADISLIRTGIDTEAFRPRGRRDEAVASFGLDPRRPVVGWIGRFEPQKGPIDYISALEIVAPRHPDAQFVIAGDGRMRAEVTARLAGPALAGRVTMLPWQKDPAFTLEGFDIFAMSSLWEGLPLTLLEAMACGAAPVSTDVDGCAEVVEDGVSGRLVSAARPDEMAEALDSLLSAPNLPEIAAAARRRIEAEFDQRGMIDRWSDLLLRFRTAHADGTRVEALP